MTAKRQTTRAITGRTVTTRSGSYGMKDRPAPAKYPVGRLVVSQPRTDRETAPTPTSHKG